MSRTTTIYMGQEVKKEDEQFNNFEKGVITFSNKRQWRTWEMDEHAPSNWSLTTRKIVKDSTDSHIHYLVNEEKTDGEDSDEEPNLGEMCTLMMKMYEAKQNKERQLKMMRRIENLLYRYEGMEIVDGLARYGYDTIADFGVKFKDEKLEGKTVFQDLKTELNKIYPDKKKKDDLWLSLEETTKSWNKFRQDVLDLLEEDGSKEDPKDMHKKEWQIRDYLDQLEMLPEEYRTEYLKKGFKEIRKNQKVEEKVQNMAETFFKLKEQVKKEMQKNEQEAKFSNSPLMEFLGSRKVIEMR